MRAYRRVLGLPGMLSTIALMFLARLRQPRPASRSPCMWSPGWAVATARQAWSARRPRWARAMGGPPEGRLIDRHGLRPVVAACGITSTVYYLATPPLPYETLVLVALPVVSHQLRRAQARAARARPEVIR